jgi:hypothetical protein
MAGESCSGGKKSKERVKILPIANGDGTEKETMILIGKSANSRCFKNIKRLPVKYFANRKAWMTSDI